MCISILCREGQGLSTKNVHTNIHTYVRTHLCYSNVYNIYILRTPFFLSGDGGGGEFVILFRRSAPLGQFETCFLGARAFTPLEIKNADFK